MGSRYRIVVGIDGSQASSSALCWALEEARLREGSVRAVTAWQDPILGDAAHAGPHVAALKQNAADVQAGQLADAAGAAIPIEAEVIEGQPSHVLLEAARDADLLVVGARDHGGYAGLLLGSLSAQLVYHAPCSVMVVRAGGQAPGPITSSEG